MRKNFTRLVCVGIASFCMMTVFGQERMPAERNVVPAEGIRLRASERQRPDSVVKYDDWGHRNGVYHDPVEGPRVYFHNNYNCWVHSLDHFYIALWPKDVYEVKYNSQGLVESFTYNMNESTKRHLQFQYNENGYLLSEESYYQISSSTAWELYYRRTFFYDTYENWVGSRSYDVRDGSPVGEAYSALVDDKGRIVYSELQTPGGYILDGQEVLFQYYIWYYSEGRTPNVAVANNNPIGTNNLGNFDVNVNIPTDSIGNGSITITFPEGFMLDTKNTKLTADFTTLFTLTVTKQDNNSWLLEIKPKTLRSASLRAGEAKKMLQVAYTVDAKKKKGIYDISVNSILFETKGGNYYPEPAITVPAVVERLGVNNEQINMLSPLIYASNQTIYIQIEKEERIEVYSVMGQKLYESVIQSGLNTISATHFPQGILFFKGSSGWVKKVVNR